MEPVSALLGAAPKALDAALKLAGAFRAHQDAREAELRLLRVLYFEVCRNLGVLDRFHVEDRAGFASNDDAYRGVAKLLDVDAHLAVVLVRRESQEERDAALRERERALVAQEQTAAQLQARALRDAAVAERLAAHRATWGELWDESWTLAGDAFDELDPETSQPADEGARAQPPSKKVTTMSRSLAFVSVKVPTLVALGEVDEASRAVMRDVRVAVRLEQIRQHESALKRRLEALPVIASVRV